MNATDLTTATLAPSTSADTVLVAGHELTLFVESPPLIDSMVHDILNAKFHVWLETYIFFNDDAGEKVAAALKQKAAEGLDVKLLYDAVGSLSTPRAFINDLAAAGVQIHEFHSLLESLRRFRPLTLLNRRNHRKLLVIDSNIGYFGGMNIVHTAENVAQQKAEDRPTSSGWRDVHVRLLGPQQPELAESFDRSWRRAKNQKIPPRARSYRKATQIRQPPDGPSESIRFFDSGPGTKYSRAARVFSYLIRGAKHNVTLSMAYFLPTGRTLRALLAARRRRVRIRVIVPGVSDVKLVQRATSHLYTMLIHRRFRIFERQHQMLHSKTMIVDELHSLVGSCNLDPRSLYINLEFLAVIRSPAFAQRLMQIARFEVTQSCRITQADCDKVSLLQRLLNRLAWTLRWWL